MKEILAGVIIISDVKSCRKRTMKKKTKQRIEKTLRERWYGDNDKGNDVKYDPHLHIVSCYLKYIYKSNVINYNAKQTYLNYINTGKVDKWLLHFHWNYMYFLWWLFFYLTCNLNVRQVILCKFYVNSFCITWVTT